ncbi:MAG: hypothetical protein AMS15_02500 [Planctomycetes bacterium DG_23]|nr:MAG: hypothetical protein AMS15_02500 [Planctomycetes bacterium DG_23]
MAFRKKPRGLSRDESFATIPVRNQLLEYQEDEEGLVSIKIPRKDTRLVKAMSKMMYVPPSRVISLDEIGSYVWRMCDGQTTVRQIIDDFRKTHKLSRKEAEIFIVTFLRTLAKKGIIGLAVPSVPSGTSQTISSKS